MRNNKMKMKPNEWKKIFAESCIQQGVNIKVYEDCNSRKSNKAASFARQ